MYAFDKGLREAPQGNFLNRPIEVRVIKALILQNWAPILHIGYEKLQV